MSYPTPPRTWVSGEFPTAAEFNAELRDALNAAFPLGVGAWTTWAPTLTQSGTVTKTDDYAKYQKIGRTTFFSAKLSVTGSGTGANPIRLSLPVAAAFGTNLVIGSGWIYDSSASAMYKGILEIESGATTVQFRPTTTTANDILGSAVMTAGLASGDLLSLSGTYEAAS